MRWVLMYEDPTSLNLLPIQPYHKLRVSDTLSQLVGLALAVWDEGFELAEGHAGWASYKNQRLFLVDVLLGLLPPMFGDIEIPPCGEVHCVPHLHAKFGGLLADSRRGEDLTQIHRAQAVRQGGEIGFT